MPASTTHGVPYPLPSDLVQNGAGDMQAIAEAVEGKVLNGRIDWGPPGAPDTNLYRAGGGTLKTDGNLQAGGDLMVVSDSGRLYFGAVADASLYRTAAGTLKTDGHFFAAGYVAAAHGLAAQVTLGARGPASEAGITFGNLADTNLYRSAAGVLATDGSFNARDVTLKPPSHTITITGVLKGAVAGSLDSLEVYVDGVPRRIPIYA